jgi:hypothetical protein
MLRQAGQDRDLFNKSMSTVAPKRVEVFAATSFCP